MKHQYNIYFGPTTAHSKETFQTLVHRYPEVEPIEHISAVRSRDEHQARALFEESKRLGLLVMFDVVTTYVPEDGLTGELGILRAGSVDIGASFPKDAFDFSTGCPQCGLGAAQVGPPCSARSSKAVQTGVC